MIGTTRTGCPKKEGQKHQNEFKFRANRLSKKSKALASTPLDRLCKRCYEKLKWKLTYHKYKPLREPGKCLKCASKTVAKAYRSFCDVCSSQLKICSKCGERLDEFYQEGPRMTKQQRIEKMEAILDTLKEREKRSLTRAILKGEIDYDPVTKGLIYTGKDSDPKKPVSLVRGKKAEKDDEDIMGGDSDDMGPEEEGKSGDDDEDDDNSEEEEDKKKGKAKEKTEEKTKGKVDHKKEEKDEEWEDEK